MRKTQIAQAVLVMSVLVGCGGVKETPKDTTTVAAPAMAPPAAKTLAEFAGTWSSNATLVGVEKPVPSTLTSSADGATWTISLEGRPNIAATASISGDSLVLQSAEYESVLRKGVMVTTRTATVMSNGAMTGNMEAIYKTPKGEEKVLGTISSVKK